MADVLIAIKTPAIPAVFTAGDAHLFERIHCLASCLTGLDKVIGANGRGTNPHTIPLHAHGIALHINIGHDASAAAKERPIRVAVMKHAIAHVEVGARGDNFGPLEAVHAVLRIRHVTLIHGTGAGYNKKEASKPWRSPGSGVKILTAG
jgi:hypothetical protein